MRYLSRKRHATAIFGGVYLWIERSFLFAELGAFERAIALPAEVDESRCCVRCLSATGAAC